MKPSRNLPLSWFVRFDLASGRPGGGRFPRAWAAVAGGVLAGVLGAGATRAELPSPPIFEGFEAPDYAPGNVNGQHGWSVESGVAEVTADEAHSGKGSLKLFAASPFSQARLRLAAASPPHAVSFVDCWVHPVAVAKADDAEMLDIDGARIAVFRTEDPAVAEVWLFDASAGTAGEWVRTAAKLPVAAEGGRADKWMRVTLREDFLRQAWDCWIDGRWVAANLGFHEPHVSHTENYVIMGDAAKDVFLDDLAIDARNPFGVDSDLDGFLDADEKKWGWNAYFDDRDADANRDGTPNLEEAVSRLAKTDTAPVRGTQAPPPAAPFFSRPGGVVEAPVELGIGTDQQGKLRVVYTLDGSDPRLALSHAAVYEKPLQITTSGVVRAAIIDEAQRSSAVITAAFVFPAQIATQTRPAGAPETVTDGSQGGGSEMTYTIPFGVKGEAPWAEMLAKAPIVVLAASETGLFGAEGLYSKTTKKTGLPAALQVTAGGGTTTVSEAVLRVSGESSRFHDVTLKHSLRVDFPVHDADLGPVFGQPSFACSQVLFRHPTQDSWAVSDLWSQNRRSAKYITDAWANSWLHEQGHPWLNRKFVHLFLNGLYWGVYEAVEQNDRAWAARHKGEAWLGDAPVDALLEAGPSLLVQPILGEVAEWKSWQQALLAARRNVASGVSDEAQWEPLMKKTDAVELTDYILFNWWLTNLDWPDRNYLILSAGGRFHFISWDAEFGLRQSDGIQGNLGERIQTAPDGPANVFWSLCHSAAFRQGVRARLAALVAAEGGLNPESLATSFSRQIEGFAPFAAGEAARWGAIYQRPPATVAEWEKNTSWVTGEVIPKRSEILAAQVTRLMDAMDKNTETWAAQAAWRAAQGPSVRPVTLTPVVADPAKRDRDHDGLPDEWELAHGLNAKDPSDASADADHDGLTNLQEFLLGTDPGKADERANFVREDGGEVFSRITQRIKRSTLQRQARAAREIQLIEQEAAKKAAEEAKAQPEEPTPAK